MNKLPFFITAIFITHFCTAQVAPVPFNVTQYIDINNIKASASVHGDMWHDSLFNASCFFPNGSVKTIMRSNAIWMSGYDESGKLHIAARAYGSDALGEAVADYWPGPLDGVDSISYAVSKKWAKIWKTGRGDILTFLSNTLHTIENTPAAILDWPGAGNTYATASDGSALPMAAGTAYAPFVDLNGNGIYEPLLGEYPDIKGDQMLWWIYNDHGPAHNETNGRPLGMEIKASAYAYKRNTLIDNVIYYQYDITNKSPNTYDSFRIDQWSDPDLGYYYDDYVGLDTPHNMVVTYNGTECDGCAAGYPANSYGPSVPKTGLSIIEAVQDGIPLSVEHYNLRYSYDTNDTMFQNDIINAISPSSPFFFLIFIECIQNDVPSDRKFNMVLQKTTIPPGGSIHMTTALVVTDTGVNQGCPTLDSTDILAIADTAWANYFNPLPLSVQNTLPFASSSSVFPNPVLSDLHIKYSGLINAEIAITDIIGQTLLTQALPGAEREQVIHFEGYPPGTYLYHITSNGHTVKTGKLLKQ